MISPFYIPQLPLIPSRSISIRAKDSESDPISPHSLRHQPQQFRHLRHRGGGVPVPGRVQFRLDPTAVLVPPRGAQLPRARQRGGLLPIRGQRDRSPDRLHHAHCTAEYWLEDLYGERRLGRGHVGVNHLVLGRDKGMALFFVVSLIFFFFLPHNYFHFRLYFLFYSVKSNTLTRGGGKNFTGQIPGRNRRHLRREQAQRRAGPGDHLPR